MSKFYSLVDKGKNLFRVFDYIAKRFESLTNKYNKATLIVYHPPSVFNSLGTLDQKNPAEKPRKENFLYERTVAGNKIDLHNNSISMSYINSACSDCARKTPSSNKECVDAQTTQESEKNSIALLSANAAGKEISATSPAGLDSHFHEKYWIEAEYMLLSSLNLAVSFGISPDYNYLPSDFFRQLNETFLGVSASDEVKKLLKLFLIQFQYINQKLILLLEDYIRQRLCLVEVVDYYNKFYYFERSRDGGSKAFAAEKKLKELAIYQIVKSIFFLEFQLFYNASARSSFKSLQDNINKFL